MVVNPEIDAAARGDRQLECRIGDTQVTRARMNSAELRVGVGRDLVEFAEGKHRAVGKRLRRNILAADGAAPGIEFESAAQPAVQVLIRGTVAAVQVKARAGTARIRGPVRKAA